MLDFPDADEIGFGEKSKSCETTTDRTVRHLLPRESNSNIHRQIFKILLSLLLLHSERRLLEHFSLIPLEKKK